MSRYYQARSNHGPLIPGTEGIRRTEEEALQDIVDDIAFSPAEDMTMRHEEKLDAARISKDHKIDVLVFEPICGFLVCIENDNNRENDTFANDLTVEQLQQYGAPKEQIVIARRSELNPGRVLKKPFVQVRGTKNLKEFDSLDEAEQYALNICRSGPALCGIRVNLDCAMVMRSTANGIIQRMLANVDEEYINSFNSSADAPGLDWDQAEEIAYSPETVN
jgi:hypothetical protein